ncbi:MAG: Ppx/GppA phosphatase family protein [Methanosarcinaceae archaeon]|nr:Ppx/GppA phosphatase family protein [Methanosarcinaceae archaeon]MDD4748600.1 Ppx/GppA phosphatase family protein [Methanosarcinaceae archaeon]
MEAEENVIPPKIGFSKPNKASEGRVVGFIDIGTNSVRLLLVQIDRQGTFRYLTKQKETVRLGEKGFIDRILQPAAMQRAGLVCKKFVELARAYGAAELIAVATSATRDASNKVQFLEMLKNKAKLEVCPISGAEEARLIYLGVSSGLRIGASRALFIDIGGGSTEISLGDQKHYYYLNSLNLGAIRLTNIFLPAEKGPVSQKRYRTIKAHVKKIAAPAVKSLSDQKITWAVGSSGTIETLGKMAFFYTQGAERKNPEVLEYGDLKKVVKEICALSLEERGKFPGINSHRADIIIAGAAILEVLMEELGLSKIRISKRGLREGLLEDYLSKSAHSDLRAQLSVRKRSVMQLGLTCHFDETHALFVARLALELFDSARAIGIYEFRDEERELLEYAALLHDIGLLLSYDKHHAYAYHIIKESNLAGFNSEEIEILANLAYFHKKTGGIKKKDPRFEGLKKSSVKSIRVLSALLRLAEGLDRSRAGIISHVRFYIVSTKTVVLEMHAQRECQLELWEVENQIKYFKKIFGYNLSCKVLFEPSPRYLEAKDEKRT